MVAAGDNRVIVSAPEVPANDFVLPETDANLWQVRIDQVGAIRRLTNWTGFPIPMLSITPDGRRLVLLQTKYQEDVWVGGLEANESRLVSPRRVTLDDRNDRPVAWTMDSQSVVFMSTRGGTVDLFVQSADPSASALMIAGGPGGQWGGRSTADGRWILDYEVGPPRRLKRVSPTGGVIEDLGTVPNMSGVRCVSKLGSSCVIEERESGRNVVRLLDPIRGPGALLFEKPAGAGEVAPSPDTERYAYFLPAQPGAAQHVIRVVTSNGTVEREIVAMGATRLGSLDYTATGDGFFTSDYSTDFGARLLHVSMSGAVSVLWHNRGARFTWGVPSPDGKSLALLGSTQESNVWMLEGF